MKGLRVILIAVAMFMLLAVTGCFVVQPGQLPQIPGQPVPVGPGQGQQPMPEPRPGEPGFPGEMPGPHPQGEPGPHPEFQEPHGPEPQGNQGQQVPSGNMPPGCPGAPVISNFTASKTTINAGETVMLSWGGVTNGPGGPLVASVRIEPGVGEVGHPSSRPVLPAQTTTYTLIGTGCGGTATKQVTVNVNASGGPGTNPGTNPGTGQCTGAPSIASFTADPASIGQGQKTKLKWGLVSNATKVEIDHGIGGVATPGEREVSPTNLGTTTYTLTATGCNGSKITKQASVSVMLVGTVMTFDLGLADVYPHSSGKIMARIKNYGTGAVKNASVQLACSASITKTSGNSQTTGSIPPVPKTITVNLEPGQTADYETGHAREPSITTMSVSCTIQSNILDSNSGNNSMSKQVK